MKKESRTRIPVEKQARGDLIAAKVVAIVLVASCVVGLPLLVLGEDLHYPSALVMLALATGLITLGLAVAFFSKDREIGSSLPSPQVHEQIQPVVEASAPDCEAKQATAARLYGIFVGSDKPIRWSLFFAQALAGAVFFILLGCGAEKFGVVVGCAVFAMLLLLVPGFRGFGIGYLSAMVFLFMTALVICGGLSRKF